MKSKKGSQVTKVGEVVVETWWDRSSRNYITYAKNAAGNEAANPRTGETSTCDGNRDDANVAHDWWVEAFRGAEVRS